MISFFFPNSYFALFVYNACNIFVIFYKVMKFFWCVSGKIAACALPINATPSPPPRWPWIFFNYYKLDFMDADARADYVQKYHDRRQYRATSHRACWKKPEDISLIVNLRKLIFVNIRVNEIDKDRRSTDWRCLRRGVFAFNATTLFPHRFLKHHSRVWRKIILRDCDVSKPKIRCFQINYNIWTKKRKTNTFGHPIMSSDFVLIVIDFSDTSMTVEFISFKFYSEPLFNVTQFKDRPVEDLSVHRSSRKIGGLLKFRRG